MDLSTFFLNGFLEEQKSLTDSMDKLGDSVNKLREEIEDINEEARATRHRQYKSSEAFRKEFNMSEEEIRDKFHQTIYRDSSGQFFLISVDQSCVLSFKPVDLFDFANPVNSEDKSDNGDNNDLSHLDDPITQQSISQFS